MNDLHVRSQSLTRHQPPQPQRTTNEDLTHLRSQTITVEVNMARLFNWNVQNKKKLGAAAAGATPKFREVST